MIGIIACQTSTREEWISYERAESIEDILFVEVYAGARRGIVVVVSKENDSFFSMSLRNRYILPNYIILTTTESSSKQLSGSTSRSLLRLDKEEMNIYDLVARELVETIDVIPLVEPFAEEYQLTNRWPRVYEDKNGELYLKWEMRNIPETGDCEIERRLLLMNFQTRKTSLYQELPERFERSERQIELIAQSAMFSEWDANLENQYYFMSKNGLEVGLSGIWVTTTNLSGVMEVSFDTTHLPQENQELYSMFPGLQEFIGQSDLHVIILLEDYPTAEEIFNLLIEDGQEITFEGSVLAADRSIDGYEHEITSFEDFFRLIDLEGFHGLL